MPKSLLKRLARVVLGDYAPYQIYACDTAGVAAVADGQAVQVVDQATLEADPSSLIRAQAVYAGEGARAYAATLDGRIVAVCFYWWGGRYLKRNFWPLREGEAKLVQVIALPEARGRGVATALIAASCRDMGLHGFMRTYARVWHSNMPSRRAFERAGWKRVALVIEANPLRRRRPLRLQLRATKE
jgi:RimJ/RimL family protein N-acetyltransferase